MTERPRARARVLDELESQRARDARMAARREARLIDLDTPYEDDPVAQACVHALGPMQLEVIGDLCGLTRERIRQIEARALQRFYASAERMGLDLHALVTALAQRNPDPELWSNP